MHKIDSLELTTLPVGKVYATPYPDTENAVKKKSYYDLLNSVRIEKAKELLADPGLKIGDFVDLVGYSDSGHFFRTFKKLTGLSANEYRSRLN